MREKLLIAVVSAVAGSLLILIGQPLVTSWFKEGPQLSAEAIAVPFQALSEEWQQLDGAVYLQIINNGTHPAIGVSLVVPGAKVYRRGPWTMFDRAETLWSDSEKPAVVSTGDRIILGALPQGQTESLVVWTTKDYASWIARYIPVEIVLRHDTGIGTVSVRLAASPVAAWLDRNLIGPTKSWLAVAGLAVLLYFAALGMFRWVSEFVLEVRKKQSAIDKKRGTEPKDAL